MLLDCEHYRLTLHLLYHDYGCDAGVASFPEALSIPLFYLVIHERERTVKTAVGKIQKRKKKEK
jgi:hypothetical protein